MTLNLPKPIAAYFAADKADGEAVSQCFTEDALVKDEGHTHQGRAAIKQWKTASASINTRASLSRASRRAESSSSSAMSPATFQAARLTFGSFSSSKATISHRWQSFPE